MTRSLSFLGILVFSLQLSVLQAIIPDPYVKYSQLNFPAGPFGPDSVALDGKGNGPYVGISDGRILKYDGDDFVDFAYLSPNRNKTLCDGVRDIDSSKTCGRPLGLTLDPSTGNFYVVGAYGGLYRVGREGGLAELLANDVNGVPFNFLGGIDYDKFRNVVYFTDASLTFTFKDQVEGKTYLPGESSGRLIEYNIATGKTRLLLQNLPVPVGPAVSEDGKFVVYSSRKTNQVFKYSIAAGNTAVLLNLPGYPIKTKRAPFGTFWVAVNEQKPDGTLDPYGYKFDLNGNVILRKSLGEHYANKQVNVVQEYSDAPLPIGAKLYIGSRMVGYVGKYRTIL